MRNILEKSTFKGIIAGFFVCLLFGVVVFADWTNLKSFRNTWGSDAPSIENKLSAETWNSVLQELDQLKVALSGALNSPSIAIPSGAVMAFDLTTGCPTGWEPFTLANDRFLMGTSTGSEVRKTGGKDNAQLTVKNIPAHYHYYKDTIYAESHEASSLNYYVSYDYHDFRPGANNNNGRINNKKILAQGKDDVWFPDGSLGKGVVYGSDEGGDHDNYPIYGVRATSNEICGYDFGKYMRGPYNVTDGLGGRFIQLDGELERLRKSLCYGDGRYNMNTTNEAAAQEFSIKNSYVKVIYCRKQ